LSTSCALADNALLNKKRLIGLNWRMVDWILSY
jgi:hypothetical protein